MAVTGASFLTLLQRVFGQIVNGQKHTAPASTRNKKLDLKNPIVTLQTCEQLVFNSTDDQQLRGSKGQKKLVNKFLIFLKCFGKK